MLEKLSSKPPLSLLPHELVTPILVHGPRMSTPVGAIYVQANHDDNAAVMPVACASVYEYQPVVPTQVYLYIVLLITRTVLVGSEHNPHHVSFPHSMLD